MYICIYINAWLAQQAKASDMQAVKPHPDHYNSC